MNDWGRNRHDGSTAMAEAEGPDAEGVTVGGGATLVGAPVAVEAGTLGPGLVEGTGAWHAAVRRVIAQTPARRRRR